MGISLVWMAKNDQIIRRVPKTCPQIRPIKSLFYRDKSESEQNVAFPPSQDVCEPGLNIVLDIYSRQFKSLYQSTSRFL